MAAIAVIIADLQRTRLGLPSRLNERLGDRTVLAHTVGRAAKVRRVESVVIVHPAGQDMQPLLEGCAFDKPVHTFADADGLTDRYSAMRIASRKWALPNWRGGLGGALCYDELLPAAPILAAMREHGATSALLAGGDWPFLDAELCSRVLALNLEHPEAMRMTFTQAPPGLTGVAVSAELLEQMAGTLATFGQVIAYDPKRPQADPIGRDVCVQIAPAIRNCARRFIYDTPRSIAMLRAVAARFDDEALVQADAQAIVNAFHAMASNGQADAALLGFADMPQQVTLELNTRRLANGPIVPQHHIDLSRDPIPTQTAMRIVQQLGEAGDVALTLGGMGDPLLHEDFADIIVAAHMAGVFGIAVETDLLVEPDVFLRLLDLPVDVVTVRLNADCAATYRRVMGVDRFGDVIKAIETLLNERNRRSADATNTAVQPGVPWIVPRMIKTADNVGDLESFFDRWIYYTRHAVIESPTDGGGVIADQSVLPLAPPRRYPCRQITRRMTILCDGSVAQCDQDWFGRAAAGNAGDQPVAQLWHALQPLRRQHAQGAWEASPLCGNCRQWYRA